MRSVRRLPIQIAGLVLLAAVLAGIWQYQAIHDWLKLRDYTPSSAVSQLVSDIELTGQGRKLLYVNQAAVEDRAAFNVDCANQDEQTIVLGCYHPVDRGIYIFDVSDARLTGVEQVTTAHEMLHAAYDRLSSRDRMRIDEMLQDYYKNHLTDKRIRNIIAAYTKSEPNDVTNEMHSVFGTEVADLPGPLETYYAQFFQNRAKVVQYARTYQAEFTSRETRVAVYDADLKNIQKRIDTNTAELTSRETQIGTLRQRLDAARSDGDNATYNQLVPQYNASIDAYNNIISATKSLIITYNQQVNERNALALQVADLAKSIDSSPKQIK